MVNQNVTDDIFSVLIDVRENKRICVACAERRARDGGWYGLWWRCHPAQHCNNETTCSDCGKKMDNKEAQEAAISRGLKAINYKLAKNVK